MNRESGPAGGAVRTTADEIIAALVEGDVRYVFGIPGITTLEYYRALATEPRLTVIGAHHEQGAAFMADGYARATGKVGVLCIINGPGVTNALTGIAEAYYDSSPLLVLTTESESAAIGLEQGFVHELKDQLGMASQVCKAAIRVAAPDQAFAQAAGALALALSGRPRPVYVEVPADVMARPAGGRVHAPAPAAAIPPPDRGRLESAASLLDRAQRPVLYVGGGLASDAGRAALRRFAEGTGIPVITTVKGKNSFPAEHPLATGATSFAAEMIESDLLREADLVLAVGTRLSARLRSGAYGSFRFPEPLIHVDVDPQVLGANFRTAIGLQADGAAALDMLGALVAPNPERSRDGEKRARAARTGVSTKLSAKAPVIARFLADVRAALPAEAIVVGDNAMVGLWSARYLPVSSPGMFLHPMGYATLGFAVPAAIGARLGRPDRPVVALVGDGSFLFTAGELAVAVQNELDLTIILINDGRWGSVHYNQRKRGLPVFATHRRNPDFQKLAEAYSCHYQGVKDPHDIGAALDRALVCKGVNLIEVDGAFMDWY